MQDDFDRSVFCLCVLGGREIRSAAVLLGCDTAMVEKARVRSLNTLSGAPATRVWHEAAKHWLAQRVQLLVKRFGPAIPLVGLLVLARLHLTVDEPLSTPDSCAQASVLAPGESATEFMLRIVPRVDGRMFDGQLATRTNVELAAGTLIDSNSGLLTRTNVDLAMPLTATVRN